MLARRDRGSGTGGGNEIYLEIYCDQRGLGVKAVKLFISFQ